MIEEKQTFFLSHFLEVIFSDKRDSGFGFVWSLLLHVDLKILLSVPEGPLLWAVLTARRGTLWGSHEKSSKNTDNSREREASAVFTNENREVKAIF